MTSLRQVLIPILTAVLLVGTYPAATAEKSSLRLAAGAQAQPAAGAEECGTRGDLAAELKQRFAEIPTSMGLDANGSLLEVFVSTEGTWSVLISLPNGQSCVLAYGDYWQGPFPQAQGKDV